jgi:hypothetical protein
MLRSLKAISTLPNIEVECLFAGSMVNPCHLTQIWPLSGPSIRNFSFEEDGLNPESFQGSVCWICGMLVGKYSTEGNVFGSCIV